jgi:hypothetical protein
VEGHRGEAKTKRSQFGFGEFFVADLPPTSHSDHSIQSSPFVRHWILDENQWSRCNSGDRQDREAVRTAI